MNCQEVIQLMHRELDQDLNESESKLLDDHLETCDSCAQIFERLSRLSNDLVQLPKVEPPYSIVDSIMPELERIDQERNKEAPSSVTWTERLKQSVALRMLIGASAAVIFIFILSLGKNLQWEEALHPDTMNIATETSDAQLNMQEESIERKMQSSADRSDGEVADVQPQREMNNSFMTNHVLDQNAQQQLVPSNPSESSVYYFTTETDTNRDYTSPDGSYTAYVWINDHNRYQVEVIDQSGNTIFKSAEMTVNYVGDIQWDMENNEFEYTVYTDESSAQFVVNLITND